MRVQKINSILVRDATFFFLHKKIYFTSRFEA